MSIIKTLAERYEKDEANQKEVLEDLRFQLADAERQINQIVADLHKATGLIIRVEEVSRYCNSGVYGDHAFPIGFKEFQDFQRIYQVTAKISAP